MLWRLGTTLSGAEGQRTHFGTPFAVPIFWPILAKCRHAGLTGGEKARLTRRELEVAPLVAQGLTNREIAQRLFISERTADGHLEHIRDRLGVGIRAQITDWFVRQEAIAGEPPAVEPPAEPARGWRGLAGHQLWLATAATISWRWPAGLLLDRSGLVCSSLGPDDQHRRGHRFRCPWNRRRLPRRPIVATLYPHLLPGAPRSFKRPRAHGHRSRPAPRFGGYGGGAPPRGPPCRR